MAVQFVHVIKRENGLAFEFKVTRDFNQSNEELSREIQEIVEKTIKDIADSFNLELEREEN